MLATQLSQQASCGVLSAGAHSSTAEVEHELMDLWNAVEKDKVVQAARRAAAACNRTRMEPAQPPLKKVTVPVIMAAVPGVDVNLCTAAASEALNRSVCCPDELRSGSVSLACCLLWRVHSAWLTSHIFRQGFTGLSARCCMAASVLAGPYSVSMEPAKHSFKKCHKSCLADCIAVVIQCSFSTLLQRNNVCP